MAFLLFEVVVLGEHDEELVGQALPVLSFGVLGLNVGILVCMGFPCHHAWFLVVEESMVWFELGRGIYSHRTLHPLIQTVSVFLDPILCSPFDLVDNQGTHMALT